MTPYQILYDSVLAKIRDYDFLKMSSDEVNSILFDYIRPAIVRFQSCRKNLQERDDELEQFHHDLSDDEIEVLSCFMVVEYLDANYIRIPTALKQTLSNKDFNTYSPANLLEKVTSVRNLYFKEATQLMRDYSYVDSPLFDTKR